MRVRNPSSRPSSPPLTSPTASPFHLVRPCTLSSSHYPRETFGASVTRILSIFHSLNLSLFFSLWFMVLAPRLSQECHLITRLASYRVTFCFILIFPLIAVHRFLRITCYSRRVESTRNGCSKMITINRRWDRGGKEEEEGTRGSDHRRPISSSRSRTHLHLVRLVNTYGTRTLAPFVSLHRAADPILAM